MSAIRVTAARTIGRARNQLLTAVAIGGFLAVSALLFALGLESAEGGERNIPTVTEATRLRLRQKESCKSS